MYDVHLLDGNVELPTEGTFYVVAGNGLFIHKDTGLMKGLVPVENVSFLDDMSEDKIGPEWIGPMIPYEVAYKIKRFFFKVFQKYGSEANTILYYNLETKEWKVVVPKQRVSHGSVQYRREALTHVDEFIPIGTIHSHANFNAFHSGTDDHDEETFDGIHVTFGHNDSPGPITVSASVVMNGVRTMVKPEDVLERFAAVAGLDGKRYTVEPPNMEDIARIEDEVEGWLENVQG